MPVYNTSAFVAEAIASVLIQEEVAECIIIDDGSTDKSLEIIQEFADRDNRIIILHHPGRLNLGPGPSRNLGLRAATAEYIAFLDADDYWVKNRFAETKSLFSKHLDADGIYEARASQDWNREIDSPDLSMIRTSPKPDEIFYSYSPFGNGGFFSLIGLTVKRKVIDQIGYFAKDLWLTQDTQWMTKLCLKGRLYGGVINQPIAIRRFHRDNSSKNVDRLQNSRVKMCLSLLDWTVKEKMERDVKEIISNVLLKYHYELNNLSDRSALAKKSSDISLLIKLWFIDSRILKYPRIKYFLNLVFHLPIKQSFDFYE